MISLPRLARSSRNEGRELGRARADCVRDQCGKALLYAFQARPFCEKMGFTVFGRLDGPTPIFPRFFLRKSLASTINS